MRVYMAMKKEAKCVMSKCVIITSHGDNELVLLSLFHNIKKSLIVGRENG